MWFSSSPSLLLSLLFLTLGNHVAKVRAIDMDVSNTDSVKSAAKTVAYNMLTYYTGNRTGDVPGMLPDPYYWWEAGAMWMLLVEYWHYTNDSTYNDVVSQALQFQVGSNNDYMPSNESKSEGNDDQLFWALAAMSAAELNFPDPPSSKPSWLSLAQAVFNEQVSRWDTQNCGGGLRWQIYAFNDGYNYKNTVSNGGFFQLAARLARYTGNSTYADWAEKAYNWLTGTPLIKENGNKLMVYDGTSIENKCTDADQLQWTYNYGTMLAGSAFMYSYTNGSSEWLNRVGLLLNATEQFFVKGDSGGTAAMSEIACEPNETCDNDQPSFKAYLSRWLALTAQLVPTYHDYILEKVKSSATGAAGQCSGPTQATNGGNTIDGTTCGRRWYSTTFDGKYGVGEHMSALSILGAALVDESSAPVSANTGGTSESNPNAGTSDDGGAAAVVLDPISTGDKAGAAILTILVLGMTVGGGYWLSA